MTVANCPNFENYSPCQCGCLNPIGGLSPISCKGLDPEGLRSLFTKFRSARWDELNIEIPESNLTVIPENFLANHVVENRIIIDCPFESSFQLKIHPKAFNFQPIKYFSLSFCHLTATVDYSFVIGFHQLTNFILFETPGIDLIDEWTKLLPITCNHNNDSVTKNETDRPFGMNGFKEMVLTGVGMPESTVCRILKGLSRFSADTLKILMIGGNELTKIPEEIKFFTSLEVLDITMLTKGFSIPVIKAGSLRSPSLLSDNLMEGWRVINFFEIGLQRIEKGALEGLNLNTIVWNRYIYLHLFFN